MKTTNFRVEKETEKAILFTIGFKHSERGSYKVLTNPITGGTFTYVGYEVKAWIPKSVISANGELAGWFGRKMLKEAFGQYNPLLDVVYI